LDLLFSRFPPARNALACEAGGEETEKYQSRFQREKKAVEANSIVVERSCRFFILFL